MPTTTSRSSSSRNFLGLVQAGSAGPSAHRTPNGPGDSSVSRWAHLPAEPPKACSGPLPPQGGHSPARPSASAVVAAGPEGVCTCFHARQQHGGECCEAINFWGVRCSCKATVSGLRANSEPSLRARSCPNCGVRGFVSTRCPECGALPVG